MTPTASSSPSIEEDLDASSSSNVPLSPPASAKSGTNPAIAKEDLIELIRAVKFKNPDFSQRQVYQEIVTEIPKKFPQYAEILNPEMLCLNDVKKAWKKAILQQQQPSKATNNDNSDLAERLRKMNTTPEVYTVGLNNNTSTEDLSSTGSNVAKDYVARFLEEQQAESSAQQRQLLEDYVHVFLDVPADASVTKKPHQALINFQSNKTGATKVASGKGNKKKQRGNAKKKKSPAAASQGVVSTTQAMPMPPPPFEDAIIIKIQMAAPMNEHDTAKHPMLLYDQSRTYKTFIHPDGILTEEGSATAASPDAPADGYSRLARWIRGQGVEGALGSTGGTKAYFYGRLTNASAKANRILSIYVKSLAPPEAQTF